jgi:hypothetical protein
VTPLARVIAIVTGVVSLVLCGAALVRQAALATSTDITWDDPAWWADLTERSSTATIIVAAALTAVTVLLVVFAYRQVQPAVPPQVIEFAVADGTARLSVPALRKALRRRFETMLPGSQVGEVAVSKGDAGWRVRVEAEVPICDVRDVQASVLNAFRDDMRKVAGIEIAGLDLVVTSMRPAPKKA